MSSASKVPKMDGSGDGVEDGGYDPETRIALEDIDSCQKELDSLNERCSEEILEVERRYNQLRKPFFDKRNDIIQRIPKFWATAFVSHPELNYLMEEEEDLLQFLIKLEVEEFDDIKSGYRIKFHFEENPYFENDILTKDFYLSRTPASECTVIKWKEGKELTRPKEVVGGSSPGRKRAAERRTFFDWYTDNNSPTVDEIAEVIKDELWPNPLHYYLAPVCDVEYTVLNGDASEDEDCHYQSMEEEEAEEDSDAEEDEDDSEEEEDEAETDEEAEENEEVEDNDEAEENEGAEDNEEAEEEEAEVEDEGSEGGDSEENEEMHNNSGDL